MEQAPVRSVLCLASYEKGADLLREAKALGCHVILVTVEGLLDADWPRESIDELLAMPSLDDDEEVNNGISYLARDRIFDRIIPLDDYNVLMAAAVREHLRLPGMGISLARHFRDKLAMRVQARAGGVLVPDFVHVLNHGRIHDFTQRVQPPWVLKPRAEVSTIGIVKLNDTGELWDRVNGMGDRQSHFLLEQYIPGEVYHADSIVIGGEPVFAEIHKYARPPLDVFHGGGIAMSRTIPRKSEDHQLVYEMNGHVLRALGMKRGVTHMEFIKGRDDGRFYFLEVGARVGGAHTAEMVEAATGINLWREWARLEVLGDAYRLPERRYEYGGVIVTLARQEYPDTSTYTDSEIVYRVNKRHHVGFVLASPSADRIAHLQDEYSRRIGEEFATSMPAYEQRPTT